MSRFARTAAVGGMLALISTLLSPLPGGAAGLQRPDLSRIRILAIAPFADDVALSRLLADWGASRLSELAARGRFQVIPAPKVADEMKRLGIAASELISPTKTVSVGRAVGADAVITGRVTLVEQERDREEGEGRPGTIVSRVDVDIRVLEVATRLNLFQETFICQVPSWALAAMECVVRDVANRLMP